MARAWKKQVLLCFWGPTAWEKQVLLCSWVPPMSTARLVDEAVIGAPSPRLLKQEPVDHLRSLNLFLPTSPAMVVGHLSEMVFPVSGGLRWVCPHP